MFKSVHFTRLTFIAIICSLLGGAVFGQIVRIQTSATHQQLSQWAEKTYGYETKTYYPERGQIYDRWGHLLAGNMIVYEIGVDLQIVCNPRTIAETLSSQLGLDYSQVLAAASIKYDPATAQYAVITDFIRGDSVNNLKTLKSQFEESNPLCADGSKPSLRGLVFSPHMQRAYPEYSVGSNVIGFFSYRDRENGHGYYGIEGQYDQILAGTPVTITSPVDPYLIEDVPNVAPGDSLVLTIDRNIQSMVEQVLDANVEKAVLLPAPPLS